jgi:hypothetical protein
MGLKRSACPNGKIHRILAEPVTLANEVGATRLGESNGVRPVNEAKDTLEQVIAIRSPAGHM